MNISLCTDNNFVKPALICITSIFENSKGENVSVYVLTDGITDKAKGMFSLLANQYGQKIIIKEDHKFLHPVRSFMVFFCLWLLLRLKFFS